MAISAPLVFEQTAAEGTLKRQLVTVNLFMALQVAQTTEEDQETSHDKQAFIYMDLAAFCCLAISFLLSLQRLVEI